VDVWRRRRVGRLRVNGDAALGVGVGVGVGAGPTRLGRCTVGVHLAVTRSVAAATTVTAAAASAATTTVAAATAVAVTTGIILLAVCSVAGGCWPTHVIRALLATILTIPAHLHLPSVIMFTTTTTATLLATAALLATAIAVGVHLAATLRAGRRPGVPCVAAFCRLGRVTATATRSLHPRHHHRCRLQSDRHGVTRTRATTTTFPTTTTSTTFPATVQPFSVATCPR